MKTTEIAIIGLGGVGGYFGSKLAHKYIDNKNVNITFVARGKTFEAVKNNGVTLISNGHLNSNTNPKNLLQSVRELNQPDIVFICVKEYDLELLCNDLKDKIKQNTILIPLMNGVDIYERIRTIISKGIILPSCVYVASHIKEKGIIEHKGNPGKIIMGKDPQHLQYHPQKVITLIKEAGIHIDYKDNSFPDIWTKFFFIASFGLISARYNKSIGQVNEDHDLYDKALLIMKEIEAIAQKKEIGLPHDIIEETFRKSTQFPYETPTSLQLDVQSGKENNELELFAGAILFYGKKLNISVKETKKVYCEIKEINQIRKEIVHKPVSL